MRGERSSAPGRGGFPWLPGAGFCPPGRSAVQEGWGAPCIRLLGPHCQAPSVRPHGCPQRPALLPDKPRGVRGHTARSSFPFPSSYRILNSCTDLMKVSSQLGPRRRAGSAAGMATPRVTYVWVLAGHSAPGDNIHQPAEGDRGEWQGELGLQAGSFPVRQATQLGQQQGSVPGGDMTAGPSSSPTTPPCGLSWT